MRSEVINAGISTDSHRHSWVVSRVHVPVPGVLDSLHTLEPDDLDFSSIVYVYLNNFHSLSM